VIINPYNFGPFDPMFSDVVLLVGANEEEGTIPRDLSSNGIIPSGTLVTAADPNSFTGVALAWAPANSYLLYSKPGGFLPNDTDDFCIEVWADIASITGGNSSYVNWRHTFVLAWDSVLSKNAAVFSANGTSDSFVSFAGGAGGSTGYSVNLLSGLFSGLGLNRFSRMHFCIQRQGLNLYYYINGRYAGQELFGADYRNPDEVYFGSIGGSFDSTGTAEWLRMTVGVRYPHVSSSQGAVNFAVPTGPFPTK
jgi:hypothetical protein